MNLDPLNAARTLKAVYSLMRLVRDPSRLEEVFEMSKALDDTNRITPVVERLTRDPELARAFDERHRLRVDLVELRALPEGTLGRVFAEHMVAMNLDPSAIPALPVTDRNSFFRAHLYDTHDVWHAVTGFGNDIVGELGLQGFYLAQIAGPLPSILLATGFLRVAIFDQSLGEPLMDAIARGWRMGKSARPLFGIHWDELFPLPLGEVRQRLGIDPEDVVASGVTALAA